jgi:hypothetical protein
MTELRVSSKSQHQVQRFPSTWPHDVLNICDLELLPYLGAIIWRYKEEHMPFCQNCGSRMEQTDSFCKSCGTPIGVQANQAYQYQASLGQLSTSRKSKIISILLAVFLTFFTWLYTFKRDGWKFWLGLVVSSLPGLIAAIFLEFYISDVSWLPDDLLIALSYLLPMAVWLWAIIDAATKKQEWYEHY